MRMFSPLKSLFLNLLLMLGLVLSVSVARADVSVIVHPDNPVDKFSLRDVSRLFMGRTKLFPGTGESVVLLDQKQDQNSYKKFYSKIVKIGLERIKRYRAAYLFSGRGTLPMTLNSDQAVKEYIAKNKNAVGYIDSSLLDESVKEIYRYIETSSP